MFSAAARIWLLSFPSPSSVVWTAIIFDSWTPHAKLRRQAHTSHSLHRWPAATQQEGTHQQLSSTPTQFGNPRGSWRCCDARAWNWNSIQLFLFQIWRCIISWLEAKQQKTSVQRWRPRKRNALFEHVSWQEIRESLHEGWFPRCCGAAQTSVLWSISDISWQAAVNHRWSMFCNTHTGAEESIKVRVHYKRVSEAVFN